MTLERIHSDLEGAAALLSARGGRLGQAIILREETGSTNDDAKAAAREGASHGTVFLAEAQHQGRGRQGRTWSSGRGENLLATVLLRIPACQPTRVPLLSLVAGVAVRDAVAKALGPDRDRDVLVKWPNDVVVRTRDDRLSKIAGILVESALSGARVEYVVVGIGVNVHARAFSPEIAAHATSIALEGAATPDRAALLADILDGLDRDAEPVVHRGLTPIHDKLRRYDALAGRAVEGDGLDAGVAEGIDEDGRLVVRTLTPSPGALVRVGSGEVRLRVRM